VAGSDSLGHDPRHVLQDVVVRVGLAHALGELRQDLVRRRALSVDGAIREAAGPASTGCTPTATSAAATNDRPVVERAPTRAPTTPTTRAYTSVKNAASTATTSALRMTTSMSYRRYLRIAIPMPTGMAA
jgi:hypothetical protein